MRFTSSILPALSFVLAACPCARACESCDGSAPLADDIVMTRLRPRMQPGAPAAVNAPRAQLEWGQLNFIHTTDTHGWLEGHIKQGVCQNLCGLKHESNYGADWGDYISFVKHMRQTARNADVDLLVVDTGDLHDGTGLADITVPDGNISNAIFENVDYDLATIGNHELYVSAIAYETWSQFSKYYGGKYVTSNVQIYNPNTAEFEFIGNKYKYFQTKKGLNIMSFGFLYDFTGNSNVSKVITAAATVNQTWFINAVMREGPIDLFLVLGHNPARATVSGSTFGTIYNAIRKMRPDVPIQFFGGHTHVRDFAVFDSMSTSLESGRYCETLGWLAIDGIKYYNGSKPANLPVATTPAVKIAAPTTTSTLSVTASPTLVTTTGTTSTVIPTASTVAPKNSTLRYARRYLDWNRLTFEFHANGSQVAYPKTAAPDVSVDALSPKQYKTFDTAKGVSISQEITQDRNALNTSYLIACAPQNWCMSCAPFMSTGNIYSLLSTALTSQVVNMTRASVPRFIILNTGSVRYDLTMGPFTLDDKYIVSPFDDTFQYIQNVPLNYASQIISILNTPGHGSKKRDLSTRDFGFSNSFMVDRDECVDPVMESESVTKRSVPAEHRVVRRESIHSRANAGNLTSGYTTTDDFGSDGDDTIHTSIPYYQQPNYFQANASFPATGSPATVDVVFLDYFASEVVSVLQSIGYTAVSSSSVLQYLPIAFNTQAYLPAYAAVAPAWQVNKPNCPLM